MLMGQAGTALARISGIARNTVITAVEKWNEFTVGTGGGWALLIGAGGAGADLNGQNGVSGQCGGSGAAVKLWLPAGRYRVWIGRGGQIRKTVQNTDNSGYQAHGGRPGWNNGATTVGGQGGTPSILERWDGSKWVLFAVAGAGGGGGYHQNSATCRGSGGGTWSKHDINNQLITYTYSTDTNVVRGTLGGGWNGNTKGSSGTTQALAGSGGTATYTGGTGFTYNGMNADVLNQWAGGNGGTHSTSNVYAGVGGGGGGGFGGGAGAPGGDTNSGSPTAGGYMTVDNVRWGGTGSGGGHNNSCGGGGGGGGSYYPLDNLCDERVGAAFALWVAESNVIVPLNITNLFGLPANVGVGGGGSNSSGTPAIPALPGGDGGFVYTGSTKPF